MTGLSVKARLSDFEDWEETPSTNLTLEMVQPLADTPISDLESSTEFDLENRVLTVDLDTAPDGEFIIVIEAQQADGYTTYLDLSLLINPMVVEIPQFAIPIEEEEVVEEEEEVVEEIEEVPEPEPEPEQPEEEAVVEEQVEEEEEDAPASSDGSVAVAPWIPPWKTIASEADVLNFLSSSSFTPPAIVEEKKPMKLKLGEITRDGFIKMESNQKMVVPPFKELQDKQKRNLLSLSELDVNRDIVTF